MRKCASWWKNIPSAAKSSIAYIFTMFFLRAVSFFTTPIFTRLMDASQYGVVTNYNSWLSIIEVFALLGLTSAGVLNVGLNDYSTSRNRYLSALLGLSNCTTLITFIIIACIKRVLGEGYFLPNDLLIIMFIHLLIYPAQIFWMTKQRYEFKYKASTVVGIGSVVISQLISIVFVINAESDLGHIKILATELGSLFFSVPIYLLLLTRGRAYFDFSIWKLVLMFALPLIPHYLAQHIMSSSDRIMLTQMIGTAEAGIYGVVANIGNIAIIFWNAINASLVPMTFDSINRNEYTSLRKTINIILSVYGIACVAVMLIAPEALAFLAPQEYSGGINAIPPLVGVSFLHALYNVYANVEFYYKKSSQIAKATIIAAIVNLILNCFLIPHYSYVGAAYATLMSNVLLIVMHYINYRKCKIIYNDRYILVLSIAMIISVVSCTVIYKYLMLRILLLCAIVLAVLIKLKKILEFIQDLRNTKT